MDFDLLSLLQDAEARGSADFGSSLSGLKFFNEMNLLCALFWSGEQQDFERLTRRYGVYERVVTQGIMAEVLAREPFSSLDACVRALCRRDAQGLAELAKHEGFAGIDSAWGSCELIEAVFRRLSEWYVGILADARKHRDPFYETSPYVLLPMWIFALDKAHGKVVGRSCLPDTPLVRFGKACLIHAELAPNSSAHARFEGEYLHRSGGSEPDYEQRFAPYLGQMLRIRDLPRE